MIYYAFFGKSPAFLSRCFARLCDYSLFFLLSGAITLFLPLFFDTYFYPTLALAMLLLWIPIEALFISLFKTTPGKALFGIQVTDQLGLRLSFTQALKRALFIKRRPGVLRKAPLPLSRRLLALFIALGCFGAAVGGKVITEWTTGLERQISAEGWIQYNDSHFSVSLPKDPKQEVKHVPIPNSENVLTYEELTSHQTKDVYYSVSYMNLPSKWKLAGANTLLKGALDLIIKHGPKAEVLDKNFGTHQRYRTLNFHLKEGDKHVRGRLILVGNVLYKLTVVFPPSLSDEVLQDNPFLDSFEIS